MFGIAQRNNARKTAAQCWGERLIGTALLQEVLARFSGVYQLHLLTDNTPQTTAFYRSLGLVKAEKIACCAFTKI